MQQVVTKSLRDILSPSVILFVLKITALSLIATIVLSRLLWSSLSELIATYANWIPWEWLSGLITSFASLALGYTLFIIMISLFTSLMSEKLLIRLAKRHYPDTPVIGNADIVTSIWITLRSSGIFLALFILLFPLLFVPILGQIVMLYLWSVLLKAPTVYDVGSLFINDTIALKEKRKKSTLIAMIGALFNYIPVLNFFAAVFAQILFLHHIMQRTSTKVPLTNE